MPKVESVLKGSNGKQNKQWRERVSKLALNKDAVDDGIFIGWKKNIDKKGHTGMVFAINSDSTEPEVLEQVVGVFPKILAIKLCRLMSADGDEMPMLDEYSDKFSDEDIDELFVAIGKILTQWAVATMGDGIKDVVPEDSEYSDRWNEALDSAMRDVVGGWVKDSLKDIAHDEKFTGKIKHKKSKKSKSKSTKNEFWDNLREKFEDETDDDDE